MRAAAVVLAALLLPGCTLGGDDAEQRVVQAPAATSPSPVTTVRLLSELDLPSGYRVQRDEPLSPQPISPPFRPPECVQRPATEKAPKALRIFARGDSLLVHDVTVFDSTERAERAMAALGPQPGCPSTTARAPGQPDVVRPAPSPVAAPPLADESQAFVTSESTTVAFRTGRVVVHVTVVRSDMSLDDVVELARRALELAT